MDFWVEGQKKNHTLQSVAMAVAFLLPEPLASFRALPSNRPSVRDLGSTGRVGSTGRWGLHGALGTTVGAFLLGARSSYATCRASKRPINARDGKTIPQKGNWLFPSVDDDEIYEDIEDELPPKKAVEDCVYCCWVMPKKKASGIFQSWSEDEAADDEQKDMLTNLGSLELKKEWTVWALCQSDDEKKPGFYIVPPAGAEPDALIVVEAKDENTNNIQHLGVRPDKIGEEQMRQAFLDWIDSLRPKV